SLPADALVPPERKQGRRRGRACPRYTVLTASPSSLVLENRVYLSRRWIAARERLCGLAPQWPAVLRPALGHSLEILGLFCYAEHSSVARNGRLGISLELRIAKQCHGKKDNPATR